MSRIFISKLKNSKSTYECVSNACKYTGGTFRQTTKLEPKAFKKTSEIRQTKIFVVKRNAGFTYRVNRLKPRASRSNGASNKLWYALSQWSVYDHSD